MVLKRKLDSGPHTIGFPFIPRGPRSVRRRVCYKDDTEDKDLGAFELLAAVAGKLLQEGESSASSNAAIEKDPFEGKLLEESEIGFEKEKQEIIKALTPECPDRGSCVESSCCSEIPDKKSNSKAVLKNIIVNESDTALEDGSTISAFNMCKNDSDKVMLEIPDNNDCVKHNSGSPNRGESSNENVDNSNERDLQAKVRNNNHFGDLIDTNISKDNLKINVNYYPMINTDSSVQLTSFRESVPNDSFLRRKNNVNKSIRDDDENFIRCNQFKPKIRAFKPRPCLGNRRIKKLSSSKYWKVAPKLKDREFSNSERGMRRIFYNRKSCHNSHILRREGPFKKMRLFDGNLRHASDREGSSESISNTPENDINEEKIGALKSRKVARRGMSSHFVGQCPSYQSMDSHVKFSIKSFKVPDLYIEVPETATVGSLKRTVMEAVTAILQEGLRVGVLLEGEKVKDDERTLLQTGISQNGDLDKLRFSLEPISTIAPPPVFTEVPMSSLSCETPHQLSRFVAGPLFKSGLTSASAGSQFESGLSGSLGSISKSRLASASAGPLFEPGLTSSSAGALFESGLASASAGLLSESGLTSASADPLPVANMDTDVISNHKLILFTTDLVNNNKIPDSVALVPLPTASVEELSLVAMTQKSKKTEFAQRRTRRPFSVTEVEALVEAVETLGTGRWRDVKIRAFEAADHRTYVDLKDKWKTLVHTASISPQQRRGQPVPQELLDRVLGAHAYWSQHQSKQQHDKNQAEIGTG